MRILTAAALSVALALSASVAHAESRENVRELPVAGEDQALYACKQGKGPVVVTFKPETPVKDLLAWVMSFTCKTFIFDERVVVTGKKVSIIAPNKMSPAEAYRVFLAALATVNLTVSPRTDNLVKIVDAPGAKKEKLPIYRKGMPDNTDQVVRYVYRPTYIQPDALLRVLLTMKSDAGDLQLAGSMLLITEYGSQVQDMMSIAKLIDVPTGTEGLYLLPVKHTDAAKLAPKLEQLLGVGHGSSTTPRPAPVPNPKDLAGPVSAASVADAGAVPSKIVVEERTNTLILAASQAAYERTKAIVEAIDIEMATDHGAAFHVYQLGNAIAEEIAQTINAAISGRLPPRPTSGAAVPPGTPPKPVTAPAGPADRLAGATFEGQVQVIGDKATNKLIVMASGRDYLALLGVIRELDQPRRQVYIEALILEVNLTDTLDIGVSSHGGLPGSNGSLLVGGIQAPSLKSTNTASLAAANGLVGGLIGKALPNSQALFGKSIPSYAVLFQALGQNSLTNVLSAPSIIAVDNEQAKYKVGTNIPYKKGQATVIATTTDPFGTTNIDRKDLQLELDIKPHISANDVVFLEIKHDSAELGDNISELGPSWNTRSFETRVVVRDQETVVIGGLMQERVIRTKSKVPLLGDIPLLGHLFKSTSSTKKKSNLVILLTPYIIKDQLELQALREKKLRDHDEFVQSFTGLAAMKYQPKLDYRRKRGVVEEINRALLDAAADDEARRRLHEDRRGVKPGPVEVRPSE
ncbi:MAG: type II secretion system secretin GspD [Deltaproteobacteria bacterium]|nr:type II secretion system secretin GspD [Deltaproteobacteria bacterium]